MTDLPNGRDLPMTAAARWYAGQLPTVEEIRQEAYRLLGDAQDVLRSDWWPVGSELTDEQAAGFHEARQGIAAAKEALNKAAT